MPSRSWLLTLPIAALLCAGPALAASKTAEWKSGTMEAKGVVRSVDTTARTIAVEVAKKSETFRLDDASTITREGSKAPLMLSDLKPGEHLRLRYTKTNGEMTAREVVVMPTRTASHARSKRGK